LISLRVFQVAGHGGARAGAGRKPKANKHAGAVTRAEKKIRDGLPDLVALAFVRARGVVVKDVTEKGEVEYYETPPDLKAIVYLMDRIMGKPTERKEVSGPGGDAIPFTVEQALAKVYGGDS
jgi:hypothetical protein